MNYKTIGLAVGLLLGVLAFFGIHLGGSHSLFGAIQPSGQVETNTTWYTNGLFGGSAQQFLVDASGNVTTGKTLTVTTSNTATSTVTVGCIQSYATSTATSLALRFTASTTAPTNGSGVIPVVSYGTCP